MDVEQINSGSSFVFVENPSVSEASSWVFVPEPANLIPVEDAAKWRRLAELQEAAVLEVHRVEQIRSMRSIQAVPSLDSDSQPTDANFTVLKAALEAECASQEKIRAQLTNDAVVAQCASLDDESLKAALPRRCDCLGASADCHRADCPLSPH